MPQNWSYKDHLYVPIGQATNPIGQNYYPLLHKKKHAKNLYNSLPTSSKPMKLKKLLKEYSKNKPNDWNPHPTRENEKKYPYLQKQTHVNNKKT